MVSGVVEILDVNTVVWCRGPHKGFRVHGDGGHYVLGERVFGHAGRHVGFKMLGLPNLAVEVVEPLQDAIRASSFIGVRIVLACEQAF